MKQRPKPITFTIETDNSKNPKQHEESVKFEIEGAGEVVTSFVRKNEQEFFEFIKDFHAVAKEYDLFFTQLILA